MQQITAIKPQQRRKERVNVFLDGRFGFSLSLEVLGQSGLAVGDLLSPEQVANLDRVDLYHSALESGLNFLSYRPRSSAEVRSRLLHHGFEADLVEEVLQKLTQLGYVDDAAFAQFWKENRDTHNPRGERLLKAELRRKGVDQETIAETVTPADDEENAYKAAFSRAQRYRGLDFQTFRQKVAGFLLRRGFDYEVVRTVVGRLWQEVNEAQA